MLGHDPWKRYRLHPDHRNAGLLVCDAIVAARDPHFFPEHGIAHHRPDALLLWEADVPNHVEDVTATVDRKLAALEAHESQFETTMHATGADDLEPFRRRVRTRLAELGAPARPGRRRGLRPDDRPLTTSLRRNRFGPRPQRALAVREGLVPTSERSEPGRLRSAGNGRRR